MVYKEVSGKQAFREILKGSTTFGDFLNLSDPVQSLCIFIAKRNSEIEGLSKEARTVYLVFQFWGELVNGGITQFLSNSLGAYAFETVEALREIRAESSAGLLQKALAVFPNNAVPRERIQRTEVCMAPNNRPLFEELTDKLYSSVNYKVGPIDDWSGNTEDIWKELVLFMQNNKGAIILI